MIKFSLKFLVKNGNGARSWNSTNPKKEEVTLLSEYINYIKKRINKEIVVDSEYDPKDKSNKALPFKPAIFIDV